jgi:hypothetical protein
MGTRGCGREDLGYLLFSDLFFLFSLFYFLFWPETRDVYAVVFLDRSLLTTNSLWLVICLNILGF